MCMCASHIFLGRAQVHDKPEHLSDVNESRAPAATATDIVELNAGTTRRLNRSPEQSSFTTTDKWVRARRVSGRGADAAHLNAPVVLCSVRDRSMAQTVCACVFVSALASKQRWRATKPIRDRRHKSQRSVRHNSSSAYSSPNKPTAQLTCVCVCARDMSRELCQVSLGERRRRRWRRLPNEHLTVASDSKTDAVDEMRRRRACRSGPRAAATTGDDRRRLGAERRTWLRARAPARQTAPRARS